MLEVRLQEIASAKGMTQLDVSKKANLNASTVNRYWRKIGRNVNLDTLQTLADALEVTPEVLLGIETSGRCQEK